MRTLIIAPHMDDEAISCGGLIGRRVDAGGEVSVLVIHGRHYGSCSAKEQQRSDEQEFQDFEDACRRLGATRWWALMKREGEPTTHGFYDLLGPIEEKLKYAAPDEVVIPSAEDLNQDHRHLNHLCQIALRPVNLGSVKRVLEFAALDGKVRAVNCFVSLKRGDLDRKISAISCYRREVRGLPSPRAAENVEAQARVWGAICGAEFAEAYSLCLERE